MQIPKTLEPAAFIKSTSLDLNSNLYLKVFCRWATVDYTVKIDYDGLTRYYTFIPDIPFSSAIPLRLQRTDFNWAWCAKCLMYYILDSKTRTYLLTNWY